MHLHFEKSNHGWLHSKSSAVWRKSECDLGCAGLGWAPSGEPAGSNPRSGGGPGRGLPPHPRTSPAPRLRSGSPRARRSRACVLRPERPTQRPVPENAERVGGGAQEGRRAGGLRGWWAFAGGDVEDVTPRPGCCQTSGRCARGCKRNPGAAASGGGPPESGGRGDTQPSPPAPGPLGSPRSRAGGEGSGEQLEAGGPRARPRAAGREAGGPGPGPWPRPGARPRPGPGRGDSPRGSRGSGTPAGRWRGHGSREHHHAARPAGGRRQRRLPARPLQGPQAAVLQKRGLLPAHPPRRPSGWGPREERPSQ